ncbi:transaldolase family protein [Microbacterium sp. VKM Ac-2923]|uniref:transaldolase family protein n=1 Tax=Microbacterium sp. VKM Ac-2923 TaxID=2929476 RepID=UPI001FB1FCAC|nr:transaldolase family protein [Microbacterium sp. VKM Ac-2923]MCJ1707800.1 hypothetical protein [Microbacterium sp. VKM Ac-2923]
MLAFYVDSAERAAAERMLATGLFAGLTTNPAILDKAGLGTADVPEVVRWAVDAGAARVFAQVHGDTADELVARGERWRALSDRVVIKVAYSAAALEAARRLAGGGEVLVTGLHRAWQVLPAMAAGATYVAPFIARMDAAGRDGLVEAAAMTAAVSAAGSPLKVLAGSVRTPEQILTLVRSGVRHLTFGPAVWEQFFGDAVTRDAVAAFEALASDPAVVPVASDQTEGVAA